MTRGKSQFVPTGIVEKAGGPPDRIIYHRGYAGPILQERPEMAQTRACLARPVPVQAVLRRASSARRGGRDRTLELSISPIPTADADGPAGREYGHSQAIRSHRRHRRIDREVVPMPARTAALRPCRTRGRARGRSPDPGQTRLYL